jgi:dihydroneopterin aldolase
MKIYLNDIRLFGFHGVYPLEKKMGNEFLVNLILNVNLPSTSVSLDETVDYAQVFSIVKEEFSKPEELLENLINRIANVLSHTFPQISEIDIRVMKTNPPIEGFTGTVGVGIQKKIQ